MAGHHCIDGVLDDSKYAAPVPVIGVYIAAASLVCSLAMLYDIVSGFRHRKPWLPCRWFSLNSVTLTLLGIAAKLPVDLTTSMPSALDQVSKLTGTSLICVCMGFLTPSLGTNEKSECLNNLLALNIFVLTVIVNICIQIRTGVIFLFVTEHIIVMCFMLVIMLVLWTSAMEINRVKDFSHDQNKDVIKKGPGSMMQRLKLAYLYGFNLNPQFQICGFDSSSTVHLLCLVCFGVVMQAASRCLTLKFCGGTSQYDWSMQPVVLSQIITISVGCIAILCRSSIRIDTGEYGKSKDIDEDLIDTHPLLHRKGRYPIVTLLLAAVRFGVVTLSFFAVVLSAPVTFVSACFQGMFGDDGDIEEYKHLIDEGDMRLSKMSLVKGVKDMNRWVVVSKSKSLHHLSELLIRTCPSQPLGTMEIKDQVDPSQEGLQVSCLSMVLLVRIAQVCLPPELNGSLIQAYSEAREIVHFVTQRLNSPSYKNRKTFIYAEAVWMGPDFSCFYKGKKLHDLNRALGIIQGLKTALPSDYVWDEVGLITDFIMRREYSTIGDLYNYIEQMLVDMFHMYLAQLPQAVFKDVTESPPEHFDDKVKFALKFLSQIEALEAHVAWSFPVQCSIHSLISTDIPTIEIEEV